MPGNTPFLFTPYINGASSLLKLFYQSSESIRGGGGGGVLENIQVECALRQPEKGDLRYGHSSQKGGSRCRHTRQRGVLGANITRKGGVGGGGGVI